MKAFLIVPLLVGVASAGVVVLSPSEENEVLQAYDRLCGSGQVPETGKLVNLAGRQTWLYCKQQAGVINKNFERNVRVETTEQNPQTVFLRPSPVVANTLLQVEAIHKSQPTRIHVLAPEISHNVQTNVRNIESAPAKPRVSFLKSSKNTGATSTGSGTTGTQFGQGLSNNQGFGQGGFDARSQQQTNGFQAVEATQSQQQPAAAASQVAPVSVRTQRETAYPAVPVTLEFLERELKRNGNNRNAVFYVVRPPPGA